VASVRHSHLLRASCRQYVLRPVGPSRDSFRSKKELPSRVSNSVAVEDNLDYISSNMRRFYDTKVAVGIALAIVPVLRYILEKYSRKENRAMVVQGVVLAALIGAAVKGPAAFSAIVDKISTRRKNAAYEADKEKAHKSCLTLSPDIALLEAVLSEADSRHDNSPDIARIRRSRDSVRRASPKRAGKKKPKPKPGKKAAPTKATKKAAPKKTGKKAAPKVAKAAPKKKSDKKKAAPKNKLAKRKGTPRKKAAKRKTAPKKKPAKRNIGARKVARKT
jgi:hypothetical protein